MLALPELKLDGANTTRKVKACHLKLVTPNDCSDCISLNKVQGNSFFLGSVFGLKIECVR